MHTSRLLAFAFVAPAMLVLLLILGWPLLSAVILSWRSRDPVSIAWSTPGAALLASGGAIEGGFSAAVGAFLICGILIVVAGLFRPFGRAVASIPAPLANAMLAGNICSRHRPAPALSGRSQPRIGRDHVGNPGL